LASECVAAFDVGFDTVTSFATLALVAPAYFVGLVVLAVSFAVVALV
jgi:hypothetical protein